MCALQQSRKFWSFLVSGWAPSRLQRESGIMGSNHHSWLVVCIITEHRQEACHSLYHFLRKKNVVSFTASKSAINLSLTLSTGHFKAQSWDSHFALNVRARALRLELHAFWKDGVHYPRVQALTRWPKSQTALGTRLTLHQRHLRLPRWVATYLFPGHCGTAQIGFYC